MAHHRTIEIRVLGPLEVLVDGSPVALGGPRQRAVLAHLLLRLDRPVPTSELAQAVWGDEPPASVAATLRGYVKHLRRALADTPASIVTIGSAYRLVVDPVCVDAMQFERAVMDARCELGAGRRPDALAGAVGAALAVWRGDAYADVPGDELVRQEAVRLEALRLLAVETGIEARLLAGEAAEVAPELEALCQQHPLHEGFCAQLMRAWTSCGRRAEALRAYGALRRELATELGVEPSSGLRELEAKVLSGDGVLAHEVAAVGALPVDPTPFVGRVADLARARAALDASRLTTITGAGGIGKTRLALAVVAELRARPVVFVELASVSGGDEVAATLAAALRVTAPVELLVPALAAALGTDPVVLLLDNCEHVVETAAELVHALLQRAPGLRVLATSREPLGVAGERVVELAGMTVPSGPTESDVLTSDAGRMFVERAGAVAGFVLDATNAAAVAEVCAGLDGVPLAIELTVPALRALAPDQLAVALQRDGLLAPWSVQRGGPQRHRALAAAIDWSYQLLSPEEQRLLGCLSVFADRFGIEDADAVCPSGLDLLPTLTGLVGKSMVARIGNGPPAFRLLVPIRSFAGRCLEVTPEADEVRARHARHLLTEAEALGALIHGTHAVVGTTGLDARRDDLRVALAWFLGAGAGTEAGRMASALWPYWDCRFDIHYGLDAITAALRLEVERPVRLQLLVGAVHLAWLVDELDAAMAFLSEGLALAGRCDLGGRGRLLSAAGDVLRARNDDLGDVEAVAAEASTLLCVAGDTWWEANALRLSALLALDRGEFARAIRQMRRAMTLWEDCGDVECVGGSNLVLSLGLLDLGDTATARVHAERALVHLRAAMEPSGMASALRMLAAIALAERDLATAAELADDSHVEAARVGFGRGIPEALKIQADVALHDLRVDDAEAIGCDALERFRQRGFIGDTPTALGTLAALAVHRGDHRRAVQLCDEGLVPHRTGGRHRYAPDLLRLLALARAGLGDLERAEAHARDGLARSREVGNPRLVVDCLLAGAEVALVGGRVGAGAVLAEEARSLAQRHHLARSPMEVDREVRFARRLEAASRATVDDQPVTTS